MDIIQIEQEEIQGSDTIYLFTETYPYDKAVEQTFITPELLVLKKFFKIILIPSSLQGNFLSTPEGIFIDESFANFINDKKNKHFSKFFIFIQILVFPELYKELLTHPRIIFHPRSLILLIKTLFFSIMTYNWIKKKLINSEYAVENSIFYTYWCTSITYGIGLLKRDYPRLLLISRAHGFDLFEERRTPPYIPFQETTYEYLDRLYLVSQNAKHYILKKYPKFLLKFHVSYLGTHDPSFFTHSSSDGKFRIVSCSGLVPIKRLELLLSGIITFAKSMPNLQIIWTHLGDGELKTRLKECCSAHCPNNLQCEFCGYIADVFEYYQNHEVDVFITTSASEGGCPVSIMEAQSCGIPVIATSVGGIPEILTKKTGILLSANPTPNDIKNALDLFTRSYSQNETIKRECKKNCQQKFNAENNHKKFADELKGLLVSHFQKK